MQLLQSSQGDIKIMAANNSEQQLVKYQQVIQNDQLLPVWVRKLSLSCFDLSSNWQTVVFRLFRMELGF
jgi:hypothetical protein